MTPMVAGLIILAHTITAAYIGVDPDSVRPIRGAYTMSPEEFIEFSREKPPTREIYRPRNGTVFLAMESY